MQPKVYLDDPNISHEDWSRFVSLMKYHLPSTRSVLVDEFEKQLACWLGVPTERVLATNCGTSALRLALMSDAAIPGRGIHIPALTFMATRNAVVSCHAVPIVHDVGPDTWLMDYNGDGRTIPVDLYGNLCAINNERIILDACESLGSKPMFRGQQFTCFSFNGNKTITAGAGGVLICPDDWTQMDIREKLADPTNGGYNYRMSGVNAALALVQLSHLDQFITKKKRIRNIYEEELAGLVRFQQPAPGCEPCFWLVAGTLSESVHIPTFQTQLQERGIPTRRVFRPLSPREETPVAWKIYDHGLCLPSSTLNCAETIRWVCDQVREVLG